MVHFPELSLIIVESLIAIATFDVFPSDDIYEATISPPEDDEQDLEKFADIGFEANSLILNLGTLFLFFIVLLVLPCLLVCTHPCKQTCKWFKTKHE